MGAHVKDAGKELIKEVKKKESKDILFCNNCGKRAKLVATCSQGSQEVNLIQHIRQHIVYGSLHKYKAPLCKNCSKKCKKCGKFYCPEHIKNHDCK